MKSEIGIAKWEMTNKKWGWERTEKGDIPNNTWATEEMRSENSELGSQTSKLRNDN